MNSNNTLDNMKYKFDQVVDDLLLDFVNTKLDLYKKLSDPKVNPMFKSKWFEGYQKAIKPAIEYKEEGRTEPRFKAIKIDNVEHVNDINDEMIATIRRSRFMVCDLTGYRGGVYYEAGFAYGLGLPVIYTCRKDWTKEQILTTEDRKQVDVLYYDNNKPIRVRKEGVHFDLDHQSRIEWEIDKLDEFKVKLENRIKVVII